MLCNFAYSVEEYILPVGVANFAGQDFGLHKYQELIAYRYGKTFKKNLAFG